MPHYFIICLLIVRDELYEVISINIPYVVRPIS